MWPIAKTLEQTLTSGVYTAPTSEGWLPAGSTIPERFDPQRNKKRSVQDLKDARRAERRRELGSLDNEPLPRNASEGNERFPGGVGAWAHPSSVICEVIETVTIYSYGI